MLMKSARKGQMQNDLSQRWDPKKNSKGVTNAQKPQNLKSGLQTELPRKSIRMDGRGLGVDARRRVLGEGERLLKRCTHANQ